MTPPGQKYFAIFSQTEMGRFLKVFPKGSWPETSSVPPPLHSSNKTIDTRIVEMLTFVFAVDSQPFQRISHFLKA